MKYKVGNILKEINRNLFYKIESIEEHEYVVKVILKGNTNYDIYVNFDKKGCERDILLGTNEKIINILYGSNE